MSFNIHKAISSNESLREQRNQLEKDLERNEDNRDSEWGILTDRGCIKSELSDIEYELRRRRSSLDW